MDTLSSRWRRWRCSGCSREMRNPTVMVCGTRNVSIPHTSYEEVDLVVIFSGVKYTFSRA